MNACILQEHFRIFFFFCLLISLDDFVTTGTSSGNWMLQLWWVSQVLEPHSRRVDEGFSEARVLAEVSLLPDKVRVMSGRRPVAMATGYIDRYKIGLPHKQVLVVVTSGWSVMCFDSNLQKLWENNLQV